MWLNILIGAAEVVGIIGGAILLHVGLGAIGL